MTVVFRVDSGREYRLGLDGPVLRPRDDFLGFNFNPGRVILDNLRRYSVARRLVDNRAVLATAPIAKDVVGISSEDEFIEHLRTMIYDVGAGTTLEETLGGRERFNSLVREAQLMVTTEQLPEPGWDRTFYDST